MSTDQHNDTSPLFTVIIPTKNRAKFLYHTLQTCMSQEYERLEVIVSDDGSTENNREVVEAAAGIDSRIRFLAHNQGLGMRDNFEFALRQAKPGYVIALGGDDGLLPAGIQDMRDVLRDTRTELLAWPAPVYSYPGVHSANGQLMIYRRKGTRIIDSSDFLRRQAGNLHYLSDLESPMFYVKGVASTRLIDKVRSRSPDGRFYSCPTPDGYSGIVLAGETPQFAFSGRPFSIYGLSPDSQGVAYLSDGEKAKKSSEAFFGSIASRPMHRNLAFQPYSPLITLMTVDYLLTAKDLPGWSGTVPPINFRQVLTKGLRELAHGLYGDDRICRELGILNQIAEMHGLGEFFRELVRTSKRGKKRELFHGTGINASAMLLDARTYGLHNIVDAAYAAKFIYQAFCDLTPSSVLDVVARSVLYRIRAMGSGSFFPPESQWHSGSAGALPAESELP